MRQHTVIGARIIAAAPELLPVADIVRSSHERWDGGGYPDRLAGDAIPLGARIVAVCDSFDAMTTDRAYRAAMAVEDAVAELERCAGSQFDPRVVSAFRAVLTADASARARRRGRAAARAARLADRRLTPRGVQRRGTSAASAATRSGAPARCHAGSSSPTTTRLAARVADERRAGTQSHGGDVRLRPRVDAPGGDPGELERPRPARAEDADRPREPSEDQVAVDVALEERRDGRGVEAAAGADGRGARR